MLYNDDSFGMMFKILTESPFNYSDNESSVPPFGYIFVVDNDGVYAVDNNNIYAVVETN